VVDTHPGSWKQFLAERAARGDQRAIRRLARPSSGLVVKTRDKQLQAMLSRRWHTTRGTVVHNVPNGVRLRESAGSIELLGGARDDALEQLVGLAKQRFGSKSLTLRGRKEVQCRLTEIAAERGLNVAEERER
jgi:hypothetical protein